MTITLNAGATTLTLPDDLFWRDEHTWQPVEQTTERTLTGGLVVQVGLRDGGREITLGPQDDTAAWMPYSMVAQLRNWAATPEQQMTLTIRGVAYFVIFRHHNGPALEAEPVVHYSDVQGTDFYLVTLRFMEI